MLRFEHWVSGMRVRLWLLLPLLLIANYFFAVARHEGAHALVALSSGSVLLDVHIWPPQGWNLSWITHLDPPTRGAASVQFQAALPYLISLLFLLASLYYLSANQRRSDWLWWNVTLTGVIFPLADLAAGTTAYWFADNDFFHIFGSGSNGVRAALSFWVLVLGTVSLWVLHRRRPRSMAPGEGAQP